MVDVDVVVGGAEIAGTARPPSLLEQPQPLTSSNNNDIHTRIARIRPIGDNPHYSSLRETVSQPRGRFRRLSFQVRLAVLGSRDVLPTSSGQGRIDDKEPAADAHQHPWWQTPHDHSSINSAAVVKIT